MGIGHAVYKTEDPRATWLRRFSKQMADKKGEHEVVRDVAEDRAADAREKRNVPERRFLFGLDLLPDGHPLDMYTPIFAVSRISGWTGHILEQYGNNKLIRPRAEYIGKRDQKYVPIDER